jgi:hypothetical protein
MPDGYGIITNAPYNIRLVIDHQLIMAVAQCLDIYGGRFPGKNGNYKKKGQKA